MLFLNYYIVFPSAGTVALVLLLIQCQIFPKNILNRQDVNGTPKSNHKTRIQCEIFLSEHFMKCVFHDSFVV